MTLLLLIPQLFIISMTPVLGLYYIFLDLSISQIFLLMIFTLPVMIVLVFWLVFRTIKVFIPARMAVSRIESVSDNLLNIYKQTVGLKSRIEGDVYDFHKYSLIFFSKYVENAYQEIYINENINVLKLAVAILWFLLVFWTVLEILLLQKTVGYIVTQSLLCVGFTCIMAVSATTHFKKNYTFYTLLTIVLSIFAKFITEILFLQIGAIATGVIPSITYILFNVNWLKITYLNVLNQLMLIVSILYNFSESGFTASKIYLLFGLMMFSIAIALTSAIVGHNLEKTNRLEYKLLKFKELGVEKTQRILSFLLPSFVKKRVKNGARYIADDQGTVTILFCEIVDFESICNDYTPLELTSFLDSVFQKFDSLCSSNGVTKIETVGKTYMACAGLKDSETEIDSEIAAISHAQRALALALMMMQEVEKQKLKNRKTLQVKIGINSGPVTAGVVGYHKPQFSLVGDTVNTASRMSSTLELSNKIQLSKASYDLLSDHRGLYFTSNLIEAKGKGKMHTYIVNDKKGSEEV